MNEGLYRRVHPSTRFCHHFIQAIRSYLQEEYGKTRPGDVVIDVGCGRRQPFLDYGEDAYVVGVDVSMANLLVNSSCHGRVRCDFNHLPFKKEVADRVVTVDVLEHVRSPASGCRDLVRILRPGGRLLIATPNLLSPKGLLIRFLPDWIGRLLWRLLRSTDLPYPHYYEANTVGRLQRLLGKNVELRRVFRFEEDPLWLVNLPFFPPALLYMRIMNRFDALSCWRSYFAVTFRSRDPGAAS